MVGVAVSGTKSSTKSRMNTSLVIAKAGSEDEEETLELALELDNGAELTLEDWACDEGPSLECWSWSSSSSAAASAAAMSAARPPRAPAPATVMAAPSGPTRPAPATPRPSAAATVSAYRPTRVTHRLLILTSKSST